jgi:polyphosphate kinase
MKAHTEESVATAPGAAVVPRVATPRPVRRKKVRSEPTTRSALDAPDLYLNRELTWLAFNRRVLHEAADVRNPLLERVKFLAITASNLDEFFMKRIGGLKQQVVAGVTKRTVDGRAPLAQIEECYAEIRDFERKQRRLYAVLVEQLKREGIALVPHAVLTRKEQQDLRKRYIAGIFPLVTPLAIDPAHPFPFISNLSTNLLVTVRYPKEREARLARVKVPVGLGVPRFLPTGDPHRLVPLEEVMRHNLDLLFPRMVVETTELFRVTRNADTERNEEEADDLVEMIESELRERKFAPIVRLEVSAGMAAAHRGILASEFGLDEVADVFETDCMMGLRDLMSVATLDVPALHDPPHRAIDHVKLQTTRNVFHVIRDAGALLLQHPYESYTTSVERFLREASEDPKVRAIKMTLYRTSPDSKAIHYLQEAAEAGKQVAVVVELKARFDEGANIAFANRLEEAGIHVTYGVVGLKTHCKVILVVRQDFDGLRRYVHVGTGNYHAVTARIYADLGLLTCDPVIGADVTELFNYLTTGYRPRRRYRKLLPAPTLLKSALLGKIEREIAHRRRGHDAAIRFKTNALEDPDIVKALYRASAAGVRVELVVRDSCRFRPGLRGVSEGARVVSAVGRFLEHGRIYWFCNSGKEEYFIGSADCMTRNLEHRVEVLVPVELPALREELHALLEAQLALNRNGWEMQPDGTYRPHRVPRSDAGAQETLIVRAEARLRDATRLRRRAPKGPARERPTDADAAAKSLRGQLRHETGTSP